MRVSVLFVLGLVAFACGKPPEEQPVDSDCLKLELQEEGFSTAPPARVSLFFTVDTCSGRPVAGLAADRFRLFENGDEVSRFESQQRIQPRGERMRIYSILMLDLSGSILRSGGFPKLRDAATIFLDQVLGADPELHRVALYAFDGRAEPTPIVAFTSSASALKSGLSSLEAIECSANADCSQHTDRRTCAGWRCVDDSTNLYGAVVRGITTVEDALEAAFDIPQRLGAVVIFTDGTDQAARTSETTARNLVAESTARVFTVGMGGEVNSDALRGIGKDGFFPAERADNLAGAFSEVAARLTSLAMRYYALEYCSPKRSGTHVLRVEASTTLPDKTEEISGSLSTRFDATDFASGCAIE